MAQGRVSRYAAASVVLAGGAAIELTADQPLNAGLADWAVGAAFVLAALARRREGPDPIALLAASLAASRPAMRPGSKSVFTNT